MGPKPQSKPKQTQKQGQGAPKTPLQQHDPSVQFSGKYSLDNFTNNAKLWERFVLPHISKFARGDHSLRVLLVGSAEEGMPIEFLTNHPQLANTRLEFLALFDTVDTESDPVMITNTKTVSQALTANISRLKLGNVTVVAGDMEATMLRLASEARKPGTAGGASLWDLVYIEGFHAAKVLRLTTLSFTCMRPGGLLIIDDFTNSPEHDTACPARGIEAFVDTHSRFVKVIGPSGWQAILCKRTRPLKTAGCRSEYFS